MAQQSRSGKATSGNNSKWRQVTKWLPNEVNDGNVHYRLDDDVTSFIGYYQRLGRRVEVRERGEQKAVFVQVG